MSGSPELGQKGDNFLPTLTLAKVDSAGNKVNVIVNLSKYTTKSTPESHKSEDTFHSPVVLSPISGIEKRETVARFYAKKPVIKTGQVRKAYEDDNRSTVSKSMS